MRAYSRRATALVLLKEYTRAYDDFHRVLQHDASNAEASEGLQRLMMRVSTGGRDEVVYQNAMKDPIVKMILQDPIIQNLIKDLQEGKSSTREALMQPDIKSKVDRLIVGNVLVMG